MGLAFGHGADYRHHSNLLFVENDKDPWQIGTESVASGGSVRRFVAAGGGPHQGLRFKICQRHLSAEAPPGAGQGMDLLRMCARLLFLQIRWSCIPEE